MAKNLNKLSLKYLRDFLCRNCDLLTRRYDGLIAKFQIGDETTKTVAKVFSVKTEKTGSDFLEYEQDVVDVSEILVPLHASIIQEWHIYLDNVFGEVMLYYLETNQGDKLPDEKLSLNNIDAERFDVLRKSISIAARENFSFKKYEQKIERLWKLFSINSSRLKQHELDSLNKLDQYMKMHVWIRNLFQHNRGEVRLQDLKRFGINHFPLFNNEGKFTSYDIGETIKLYKPEIDSLNRNINDYSKIFEVLP